MTFRTATTHENQRDARGVYHRSPRGLASPVALGNMLHGVRQQSGELGLVLRRNKQSGRHEYIPARQSGGLVYRGTGILGNRAECEGKVRIRHVRLKSLAKPVEVVLNGRAINKCSPFTKLGGQLPAER